ADDVTVAAVELVDAEARDVVEGRLVDVAHGCGVREGHRLAVLPSPGRCGLGERAVGEAREELGARLPLEAREPLEETLADVVLLRPAHPDLPGERAGGDDRDRREQVERALAGAL